MRDIVEDLRYASANDLDPWDKTLYERAAEEIEKLRSELDMSKTILKEVKGIYFDDNQKLFKRSQFLGNDYKFKES